MRVIKFRGWDRIKKEMIYTLFEVDLTGVIRTRSLNSLGKDYMGIISVDWMQYAGFEDENNKEIYEGDIVYHETASCDDPAQGYGPRFEVRFNDGCFKLYDGEREELLYNYHNIVEVIGNIYENPDYIY